MGYHVFQGKGGEGGRVIDVGGWLSTTTTGLLLVLLNSLGVLCVGPWSL